MVLNIDKTNFVPFHSSWKKLPYNSILKFGKKRIQRTNHIKFLGVLLDEHLTWKYHINELSKKLSRSCGIFFKTRHYVPLSTLLCLYNSPVSSFLNYGITSWGLTYQSYLNPLFLLQENILRCICFQPYLAPSAHIFLSLKILKVEDLLHFKILAFVYKCINKLSPNCFHNYFTRNSSLHIFGTRQATRADLFKSFKNTTLYGFQKIQYFGSKLCNTLPLFVRVDSSVSVFRSKLKTHFINSWSYFYMK